MSLEKNDTVESPQKSEISSLAQSNFTLSHAAAFVFCFDAHSTRGSKKCISLATVRTLDGAQHHRQNQTFAGQVKTPTPTSEGLHLTSVE